MRQKAKMNEKHHDELLALVHELRKVIEAGVEWFKSHSALATKADLKEMENRIMAKQTEVIVQLQQVQTVLNKVAVEETALKTKIDELQALVESMKDEASAELVAAVQAVADQAGVLDAIVPDPIEPPPVEPPTP